jgi:hypothetical protein
MASSPEGSSRVHSTNGGTWLNVGSAFDWETPLPRFRRFHQQFAGPRVEDIPAAVFAAMDSVVGGARLGEGRRVAITAGSRGVASIPQILAAVVSRVREHGGKPFLVPTMGSHGRATAEGQVELLAELGITPASVGAPIEASMEVVQIGTLPNGMPVYMDRIAAASDAIIVVNRVKPHTDFVGKIGSGLAKMIAIGLGKRMGADTIHRYGTEGLSELMPAVARLATENAPIALGLAIIENGYDEVAEIVGVPPSGIGGFTEAQLLERAAELMPRFPFEEIDVLIIDEMGKNISGAGLDPNILNRMRVFGLPDLPGTPIRVVAVLDLTPQSHGNATGIGLAEVTTRRLVEKIDFEATYINGLTSGLGAIERISLPVVAPTDRAAVMTSLRVCGRPDPVNARIVRIKNTLELGEIDISESLFDEAERLPSLEPVSPPFDLGFDAEGCLRPFAEPPRV